MTQNPFEPGESVFQRSGVMTSGFEQPASAVIIALYANVAVDAIQIPMSILVPNDEANVFLWGGVGILQLLVFVGCVILWCQWKMRAARNIRVFAPDRTFEYTPGWAAGWYFVPFANLVKPYHAMKEILAWSRAHSDSALVADTSMVTAWWAGWIVSNVVANASSRVENGAVAMVASIAGVISAVLAIRVVNAVNASQLETARMAPIR
jgi:hypothetical protein